MTSPLPKTLSGWMQIAVYTTVLIAAVFAGTAFLLNRNDNNDSELLLKILNGQDEIRNDIGELKGNVKELKGDVQGLKEDTTELKTDVQWLKLLLPNTTAQRPPPSR